VAQTKDPLSRSRRSSGRASGSASSGGGGSQSRPAGAGQRGTSRSASSNGADTSRGGLSAAAAAIGDAGKSVTKSAVFPVASAMAGAAAALALAQRRGNRRKKVLGISIPGTGTGGVDALAKNVGEAGKQLARLADEVSTGRKKAEEVGKALS
jgi:hypothetical protein